MRRLVYSFAAFLITSFFLLSLPPDAKAQGSYTAASCNWGDVNAVINGPTHTAVDGDTIQIPAGSCSWTTGITVRSGIGIAIIGAGTPSGSPSRFTPDSSCTATTITDRAGGRALFSMAPTYGDSTSRISCMQLISASSPPPTNAPIQVNGSCATSGCPNLRLDNLTSPSSWSRVPDDTFAVVNDVFGVADHNLMEGSVGELANVGHSAWQGVGEFGDNSWASPDTFGTSQAFYLENNTLNNGTAGTDTDWGGNGGGRFVCRFNQSNNASGVCYIHGTDTSGRLRGARQEEDYGNVLNSCSGGVCDTAFEFRSGVGRVFGNTANTAGAYINSFAKFDDQRTWRQGNPWGNCDGSSVWDTNDGVAYFSGTVAAVQDSTLPWVITSSGVLGGNGQWDPAGAPYAFHDVTQSYGIQLQSNGSNTLTLIQLTPSNIDFRPAVGDSYQILRATVCMDQPTRGAGNLVQNDGGGSPVLASTGHPGAVNEILDPTYEWNDTGLPNGKSAVISAEGQMIANRDFYMENPGQTAQKSSASPFNGTSGTGWGTLANRPATCTPFVGYFATDQGNWNQSGNDFGQGELFTCAAPNTWTLSYTPYAYPHPLITGSATGSGGPPPAAPTNLSATVQ